MSNDGRKIFVGADHAGYSLKARIIELLQGESFRAVITDLGCVSEEAVDYPDFARQVAESVAKNPGSSGILICGSGIGMAMAANKIAGVRAAQAWDVTSARLSREHNDANILCLGARLTGPEVAAEVCKVWLATPFKGGRHQGRLDKLHQLETRK